MEKSRVRASTVQQCLLALHRSEAMGFMYGCVHLKSSSENSRWPKTAAKHMGSILTLENGDLATGQLGIPFIVTSDSGVVTDRSGDRDRRY
jgi:hypothetical protein